MSVRQRVAIAKLARTNPGASGNEVRRTLLHFIPGSKVEPGTRMVRSVRNVVEQAKKKTSATAFNSQIPMNLSPLS